MVKRLLRTDVASYAVNINTETLPPTFYSELEKLIKGTLHRRGEESFILHSKIFNGDVKSPAVLLVRPFDTEDVSNVAKFCSNHSLSLSVKGGGLGTHGQAIQGKVILDISLLDGIEIETPNQDGGYTSLKDIDFSKRASKSKEVKEIPHTTSPLSSRQHRHGRIVSAESNTSNIAPSNFTGPFHFVDTAVSHVSNSQNTQKSDDPFGYLSSDIPTRPFESVGASRTVDRPFSFPTQQVYDYQFPTNSQYSSEFYMPPRVKLLYPHAYVTFGAGVKQQEVDAYNAVHPLPALSIENTPCYTPYYVPFASHPGGTSVALLGGFGFLSRLHGLSSDNLLEVEMVLADGSILIVNEKDYPDLWWAIRGAGTAFGVVTRFKMKASPVPIVFAGNLLYKFRRSTAASLIKHFRDCVKNVPRELYANLILTAGPGGDALIVIEICFLGTQEGGIEILQAITSWDGEQCLLNDVCEKTFLVQQSSFAHLLKGQPGRKWFMRSDLLGTLSDETIHETVVKFADTPTGCTWVFELAGGCVSDVHDGCLPNSLRQAAWTITAFHQWEIHDEDPLCVTSAEEWMKDTLGPISLGGLLPSFYGIHESVERVIGSFGENWSRLCEIKRKYDPHGMFSHNFWPLNKDGLPLKETVATITKY